MGLHSTCARGDWQVPKVMHRPLGLTAAWINSPASHPCKDGIKETSLTQLALRGAALYQMSWFDSLIWAYADEGGLDPLWSEDFEDGRLYGRVRVQNPFRMAVHDSTTPYGR